MKLDSIDLRILDELQRDGSLSNVELAKRVHLSPSPCLARVKAVESGGIIVRYLALANAAALGLGLNVFISISLKSQDKEAMARFERRIVETAAVMVDYWMTGYSHSLIPVTCAHTGGLAPLILNYIRVVRGNSSKIVE